MERSVAIENSALWAAYGDAIGFITELATESNVHQRAGTRYIKTTLPWKRRIGGKFGVTLKLPAGCYSDDTQLRLSVSRAIGGAGSFDVEAFAKVELPLWSNYSLGAGRGSKVAASNLIKKQATWNNNFFATDAVQYVNMGGNGAAMRIQPHVWSFSSDKSKTSLIKDIVRDSITTHGHLRGILGAVLHGLFLLDALESGQILPPAQWLKIIRELEAVPSIVQNDEQLSLIWLPVWEEVSQKSFADECQVVIGEIISDANTVMSLDTTEYTRFVSELKGYDESTRGSATKTALLASTLAYLFRTDPEGAVVTSANTLGSDTDTIGTMAGALLGATVPDKPNGPLLDQSYICAEAARMYKIGLGLPSHTFAYPDLLNWNPAPSPLDFIQATDNGYVFSVLGNIAPCANSVVADTNDFSWQWFKTSFGQSLLVKSRKNIKKLHSNDIDLSSKYKLFSATRIQEHDQLSLIRDNDTPKTKADLLKSTNRNPHKGLTVDEAFDRVLISKFNPEVIGHMLLELTDFDDSIERSIAFAALVSKARIARLKSQKD